MNYPDLKAEQKQLIERYQADGVSSYVIAHIVQKMRRRNMKEANHAQTAAVRGIEQAAPAGPIRGTEPTNNP